MNSAEQNIDSDTILTKIFLIPFTLISLLTFSIGFGLVLDNDLTYLMNSKSIEATIDESSYNDFIIYSSGGLSTYNKSTIRRSDISYNYNGVEYKNSIENDSCNATVEIVIDADNPSRILSKPTIKPYPVYVVFVIWVMAIVHLALKNDKRQEDLCT